MNFRGTKLSDLFPALGLGNSGAVTTDLPAGFIVEHGAQAVQAAQPWHQQLVDGALEHAAKNPIIVVMMPPDGYVGG